MPLTEKQLMERDAKRNIGEELLESILEVKAGLHGDVHKVEVTEAAEARSKTGLSPIALHIAAIRPDVFRDVLAN